MDIYTVLLLLWYECFIYYLPLKYGNLIYDKVDILQVKKKFCEGIIGIVEKAQETRFGMSPKYSRYVRIAF